LKELMVWKQKIGVKFHLLICIPNLLLISFFKSYLIQFQTHHKYVNKNLLVNKQANKEDSMDREEIIQLLKIFKEENKYHIKKLGIFGSVVKNRMKEESDIDIVVNLTKQDLFELIGIKQDLEERLKYPIDIVSYRETMNSFLKKRIDEEAVYV